MLIFFPEKSSPNELSSKNSNSKVKVLGSGSGSGFTDIPIGKDMVEPA